MADIKEQIVPPQEHGSEKTIEHKCTLPDLRDAQKLFFLARNRLMDVNRWHEFSGALSATFALTDKQGKEVQRTAEKGDYFKIDVPAPGPSEGEGYDWVYIEAIEDKSDSTGPEEICAIRVRPARDPKEKGENVAHFFTADATSSFVLQRQGHDVIASVFGRNEVPNTATSDAADNVRNAVVGVTAILGFANVQWKSLLKGLLKA